MLATEAAASQDRPRSGHVSSSPDKRLPQRGQAASKMRNFKLVQNLPAQSESTAGQRTCGGNESTAELKISIGKESSGEISYLARAEEEMLATIVCEEHAMGPGGDYAVEKKAGAVCLMQPGLAAVPGDQNQEARRADEGKRVWPASDSCWSLPLLQGGKLDSKQSHSDSCSAGQLTRGHSLGGRDQLPHRFLLDTTGSMEIPAYYPKTNQGTKTA